MDMVEWKNHLREMQRGVMVDILWNDYLEKFSSTFSGFIVPANYDDVGLNCGGLGVQKSNGMD